MQLKRHYKTPEGWIKEVDDAGNCSNPPPLDYVEVHHTGTHPEQHFSTRLIAAGIEEGWITIKEKVLTLHVKPEDLTYTILRVPGRYPVKTKNKPDGYELIHYYDCVLAKTQHEQYRAGKVTV